MIYSQMLFLSLFIVVKKLLIIYCLFNYIIIQLIMNNFIVWYNISYN